MVRSELFHVAALMIIVLPAAFGEVFEDYTKHRCVRPCLEDTTAKLCEYNFTLEWYHTMSKACFDCPSNQTDCSRPHCVAADGVKRGIITVNRQMPGPTIQVCNGDMIRVTVMNRLEHAEGSSIHWHGILQTNGDQYMDGVSLLTQCTIPARSTFQYNFMANSPGTHFYHSHSGMQRGDGMYGSLIIRNKPSRDPNYNTYDYDLPEHVIIVHDWLKEMIVASFAHQHHAGGDNKPKSMLINGKGAYEKYTVGGKDVYTPMETFSVKKGKKYRFRVISNGLLNCPIRISVEGHRLLMIASDGQPFKPVPVDAVNLVNGERFDFVLEANQTVDNYWVRAAGLLDCKNFKAKQTAVLRYEGAPDVAPTTASTWESMVEDNKKIVVMNPMSYEPSPKNVYVNQLEGLEHDKMLEGEPDVKFYLAHDFRKIDNPHLHNPDLYSLAATASYPGMHLYSPQINNITMALPPSPPLTQEEDIPKDLMCPPYNGTGSYCNKEFCECTHMIEVKLGQLVELVLIDNGMIWDVTHPMHLHGYAFGVVAMSRVNKNTTRDQVIQLDKDGKIERKLTNIPKKDSIMVPDGGYTVVRIKANNPGYWFYHCHNEFHQEIGMGMILKVGDPKQDIEQRPPRNWPTCGNFLYSRVPEKPSERDVRSCEQLLAEAAGGSHVQAAMTLTMTVAILNCVSQFV
ncbi:uncharacterized protein LOC135494912 [Lineus longissimus]|uniref:uncharacterized protein LOC135494912 n=1 Tax=Lineus longissimus TaxID=88925 RepID=UPI002B4F1214